MSGGEFIYKNTVMERLADLFDSGRGCDVEFLVGREYTQEKVLCHKIIISTASPVFEKMFYGSLAETKPIIVIEDLEPNAFKSTIKYIYTDTINLDCLVHALNVYKCADKYDLPYLVKVAEDFIKLNVTDDNVCEILEFSNLFRNKSLENLCLKIIQKNTKTVFDGDGFLSLTINSLTAITKLEVLNISEIDLFYSLERWAKYNALSQDVSIESLRYLLVNVISNIRFLAIPYKDFLEGPAKSELLTDDECLLILSRMVIIDDKNPLQFSQTGRARQKVHCSIWDEPTFRWVKTDIYYLHDVIWSPSFTFNDKQWYLRTCPEMVDGVEYLGLFLLCQEAIDMTVDITFRIISQNEIAGQDFIVNATIVNDWCWTRENFMKWSDFVNPYLSFIKDRTFIFEVYMKLR